MRILSFLTIKYKIQIINSSKKRTTWKSADHELQQMGTDKKVLSAKHRMEQEGLFLFSILERRAYEDLEITEGT